MVVTLLIGVTEDEMHYSVTASAMLSELFLQLLSTYSIGKAVNYGRRAKFYHARTLDGVPGGKDAILMYTAGLIWLIFLFLTILLCFSMIGAVNDMKNTVGESRYHRRSEELKEFARASLLYMSICWVSQWLFWIGYVRTMGDDYCPPNLTQLGVIWIVFSAFGALVGRSG
jgi:hypothetical protein